MLRNISGPRLRSIITTSCVWPLISLIVCKTCKTKTVLNFAFFWLVKSYTIVCHCLFTLSPVIRASVICCSSLQPNWHFLLLCRSFKVKKGFSFLAFTDVLAIFHFTTILIGHPEELLCVLIFCCSFVEDNSRLSQAIFQQWNSALNLFVFILILFKSC